MASLKFIRNSVGYVGNVPRGQNEGKSCFPSTWLVFSGPENLILDAFTFTRKISVICVMFNLYFFHLS